MLSSSAQRGYAKYRQLGYSNGAAQLLHRVLFQLPDTLGRNTILVSQLMQGRLFFCQPALCKNIAAAIIQARQGCVQLRLAVLLQVSGLNLYCRVGMAVLQKILGGLPGALIVVVQRLIEGHIAAA